MSNITQNPEKAHGIKGTLCRGIDTFTIETAVLQAKTLIKLASPIDIDKALSPDDLSHVMSLVTDLLEKVETEINVSYTH